MQDQPDKEPQYRPIKEKWQLGKHEWKAYLRAKKYLQIRMTNPLGVKKEQLESIGVHHEEIRKFGETRLLASNGGQTALYEIMGSLDTSLEKGLAIIRDEMADDNNFRELAKKNLKEATEVAKNLSVIRKNLNPEVVATQKVKIDKKGNQTIERWVTKTITEDTGDE